MQLPISRYTSNNNYKFDFRFILIICFLDENECKYRPCDVFAHCTNTLGSFSCTCFPGYAGDGLHCEGKMSVNLTLGTLLIIQYYNYSDIDECQDPSIIARCVENAECCNLPAHFACKCKPGFEGDGETQCKFYNCRDEKIIYYLKKYFVLF